jgi:micrococcal nuclease
VACDSLPCPCSSAQRKRAPRPKPRKRTRVISARISSVGDGDTVRVRTLGSRRKRYTVRLIGIDTPETKKPGTPIECGGQEATSNMLRLSFTRARDTDSDGLLDASGGRGRRVRLTTDPTQDTFDRYRRLLAYVRIRSGAQLNAAQVRAGWAKVYVYQGKPFRQVASFRRAARSAKAANHGVWGSCGGNFHTPAASALSSMRATKRLPVGCVNAIASRFGGRSSLRTPHGKRAS